MKNKYKIWGGLAFINGKQVKAIIATKTKKKAMELAGVRKSYFNDFWSVTRNENDIKTALSDPEKMFYSLSLNSEYVKREELKSN